MAASINVLGPVRKPLTYDLQSRALACYLNYHLHTRLFVPGVSKSLSDYVPDWVSTTRCLVVDLSISSMALAVYSRTQGHQQAAIEAALKYQELIQAIQVIIPTLSERNIDACLLAIFFMSRYEDAMYNFRSPDSKKNFIASVKSFSHHDGAMAILKVWKKEMSDSQPATDTIKQTRRGLIRSNLLRGRKLPEWIMQGSNFGETGLELEYDRIVVRTTCLRHKVSTILQKISNKQAASREVIAAAAELDNEARNIDDSLQAWTINFPDNWVYQQHILKDRANLPRKHFFSSTVHGYSNPAYAAVWIRYFSLRMLINSARVKALQIYPAIPDNSTYVQQLVCHSNIKLMADDLASSIPFCLGKIKIVKQDNESVDQRLIALEVNQDVKPYLASLAVWPLGIASSLEVLKPEQKSWFRAELAHLGRIIGVGVFEGREHDQWFKL